MARSLRLYRLECVDIVTKSFHQLSIAVISFLISTLSR